MKIYKLLLGILGFFVLLLFVQFFAQSREPHPYLWNEDDLKQAFIALGAQKVTLSAKNEITVTLEHGQDMLEGLAGDVIFFPSTLLDESVDVPKGQTLTPRLVDNGNGVLKAIFSDGSQQLILSSARQRIVFVQKAIRQITLQLINGITLGGVYAMIAVGYTLVYGVLMMINFAHGDIFMFGSYGAFFLFFWLTKGGTHPVVIILAFLLGIGVAMATSAGVAVIVERFAYRPLRQAPRLTLLISAIGASIFLENVMMLITKGQIKYYPNQVLIKGSIPIVGGVALEKIGILIILLSILMMATLYTIIKKTKMGKAIRAVAEDRDTAALMGINVNQIVVTTFLLGSSMAGAGGMLVGMRDTQINHMMGFLPGMKAFTAAVVGGIGNIPGAMFGGYFLGVAEAMGAQFMPAEYKDVIAFTLLVVILILRPTGIMGEVLAKKKM